MAMDTTTEKKVKFLDNLSETLLTDGEKLNMLLFRLRDKKNISDDEIIAVLEEIFQNLSILQSQLHHQIKTTKRHH